MKLLEYTVYAETHECVSMTVIYYHYYRGVLVLWNLPNKLVKESIEM